MVGCLAFAIIGAGDTYYLSVMWGEIDVNMAVQSFGGYFHGSAVALTLALFRYHHGRYHSWWDRTDSSTSSA